MTKLVAVVDPKTKEKKKAKFAKSGAWRPGWVLLLLQLQLLWLAHAHGRQPCSGRAACGLLVGERLLVQGRGGPQPVAHACRACAAAAGAMCIARIAVEKPICIEAFDNVPQVGWVAAVWHYAAAACPCKSASAMGRWCQLSQPA